MTDYNTLSDFEINKRVADYLGHLVKNEFEDSFGRKVDGWENPNYCNNPSDAWPVIVNNGISICYILNRKIWQASAGINPWCQHENPLRAACIVYLMMNEA